MMFLLWCLISILLSEFVNGVYSLGRTPGEMPNPLENPAECGRPGVAKSQICDIDFLLKKDSKDVIEGYINAITRAEIALVVVSSMSHAFVGVDTIDYATERFATQLVNLTLRAFVYSL
jgi:hypothetical protein